jgi:putative ABC transport system ATP-binding protein
MTIAASLTDVFKSYRVGDLEVPAVRGVTLEIDSGSFLSIAGPSGSGKTTILNLLGALDTPSSGTVRVGERETGGLKPKMLADFRNTHLGFVFQTFNLIPVLTVQENVELPLQLHGIAEKDERTSRIKRILEEVG